MLASITLMKILGGCLFSPSDHFMRSVVPQADKTWIFRISALVHRRSQGGKGVIALTKFLAYLVVLCFER